jgi:hypothetical protein
MGGCGLDLFRATGLLSKSLGKDPSDGRAVAQAVSRRFSTAAVLVRAWVSLCGICGGQSGTRADFLRVLGFTLPSIPPTAPHSSSSIIIRGWYNRPVVASVIVDSVSFHPKKKKEKDQLDRRLGGQQSYGKVNIFLPQPRIEPRPSVPYPVSIPIDVFRFIVSNSIL